MLTGSRCAAVLNQELPNQTFCWFSWGGEVMLQGGGVGYGGLTIGVWPWVAHIWPQPLCSSGVLMSWCLATTKYLHCIFETCLPPMPSLQCVCVCRMRHFPWFLHSLLTLDPWPLFRPLALSSMHESTVRGSHNCCSAALPSLKANINIMACEGKCIPKYIIIYD